MSRFSSPAEVVAWAESAAAADIVRHTPVHVDENGTAWQCDVNPYSTPGMRHDWRAGFNGDKPRYGISADYDTAYQRGAACARLLSAKQSE